VLLVFALAFARPPPLVPVPPLALALALWLLTGARGRQRCARPASAPG